MMRHYLALQIAALGVALLALARWLDGPRGSGPRRQANRGQVLELPRSEYRYLRPEPTKWEVTKMGLGILLNSFTWAVGVSYG